MSSDDTKQTEQEQNFDFQFDKFMKDFEQKDSQKRSQAEEYARGVEENPNREFYKRYQEDWRNSTRWRK